MMCLKFKNNMQGFSYTLRIAGEIGLGPLDEKVATLVPTGCPMSVLDGCIFTRGNLQNNKTLLIFFISHSSGS